MMKLSIAFLIATVSSVTAQNICGPDGAKFEVAGSSTVEPIALAWAEGYMKKCPKIFVNVTGGGSTTGALRVCNNITAGAPVEIGAMSRNWSVPSEAILTDSVLQKYSCITGTKGRNVTQLDVAIDGITITLIRGGLGRQNCTDQMPGKGLTIDQLRWMFTNYSTTQLVASGWNKNASLPNDDGNETSHNWSELTLFPFCPKAEIKLASPGSLSGTFTFFKEKVLPNRTEGLANNRPFKTLQSEKDEDLVNFVETSSYETYGDAVAYFGFSYYVEEGQRLYGVPIQAKGASVYVEPTQQTIFDGSYVPFSRRIYMNVLDASLGDTGPFISYGMNQEGQYLVRKNAFVRLPFSELPGILARIGRDAPDAPVPTPAPQLPPILQLIPKSAPVAVPGGTPTAPVKAPTKKCGLLGLGILCFNGCGVLGKLLGLCRPK
jgi:ABC-type phosphate transport system substrate-binding protein